MSARAPRRVRPVNLTHVRLLMNPEGYTGTGAANRGPLLWRRGGGQPATVRGSTRPWRVEMAVRPPAPSGLVYRPDLISEAEEQQALAVLEAMEFHTITMHGRTARRTVRHFGLDYGYESWQLVPTDPRPTSWPGWPAGPGRWPAGPGRWPASTRPRSFRSSSPGTRRGAPSAGTATPPCSAQGGGWGLPGVPLPDVLPARQEIRTPGGRGHP